MKSITVKSFLAYAAAGAVCAVIAWGVRAWVTSDQELDPAYKAFLEKHDAYERTKSGSQVGIDQRHFEEALAGAYPIEKLPNADLQEVARAVRTQATGAAVTRENSTDQERYDSAKSIPWGIYDEWGGPKLTDRTWKVKRLVACDDSRHCRFAPEVSVLSDPSRLVLLLNHDKAGVLSSLPTEAGDVGAEPTYPKDGPTTVELPWTHGLYTWLIVSFAFVLGFLGLGAIGYYVTDEKGKRASAPLDPPNFALGWVVMLAFAPGFLPALAVKAGLRDARPWVSRLRAKLFPGEFDAEFGELTAKLEAMRTREQLDGNAVVLGDIDALIEKVRLSKSRRHIAELRKALDAADGYVNGLEEIERDLDGRPSA